MRGAVRPREVVLGKGQVDANAVPPCCRRGLSSRSLRGQVSAAGCLLVMGLRGGTASPRDPSLHLDCW